jgi:hypothetical protein
MSSFIPDGQQGFESDRIGQMVAATPEQVRDLKEAEKLNRQRWHTTGSSSSSASAAEQRAATRYVDSFGLNSTAGTSASAGSTPRTTTSTTVTTSEAIGTESST